MKKLLLSLFIIIAPLAAFAQSDMQNYIAVVDVQKVLRDSTAAQDIRSQIKAKRDQYQDDITKQEEDLRNQEQKLYEQRNLLAPEAFNEKRDEFKENLIKVQRDVQVKRAKLDNTLGESLSEIQEVVYKIISTLSKEKGFKVAFPSSQILYTDPSLDITSEVLTKLNKDLPKIEIKAD